MNKINTIAALIATSMMSVSAFAVDGTITFNGLLVSETCSPTVSATGATAGSSTTITLPTVNISSLNAAAQTAGITPFSIQLNGGSGSDGCVVNGKTGTPFFENELAKVNTAGRLINTSAAPSGATGVDIQILDQAQTVIDLSKDAQTQLTATGNVSGTAHTYNYFSRYYATAATTAGTVNSSVSYTIIYK